MVGRELEMSGVLPCGNEAFDALRIEAGSPIYGVDITDKNLPQEVARDDRVPSLRDWAPVAGPDGAAIDRRHIPPVVHKDDQEAWWCVSINLPECRPDMRYGLLIEEVEFGAGIPETFEEREKLPPITAERPTAGTVLVERSPHFSRVVDLGDESWP